MIHDWDEVVTTLVAFSLAVAAAVLIKLPSLFGIELEQNPGFYARNAALFVLPLLTGYFVWKRRVAPRTLRWLAASFGAAVVFANIYPVTPGGYTEVLLALHLPIALWLVVGVAYAGERWSQVSGRMDFIRFSGELFIYYVLIALGGGVFTAFMALIFEAIGIKVEYFLQSWLLPCGIVGAVVVASWLVEAKQSVIENMAPVLTKLFTPLFAILLVTFLGTVLWTGRGVDIERNVLIAFDLLLVVVLGLLLYSVSARDPQSPPGAFDVLQIVLVISALLADAVALWAIASRINEFGFTPNRVAALGENVILLVNLAWSVGRRQRRVGVELVGHVGVLHRHAGLARQGAVADAQAEQEVLGKGVPVVPAGVEGGTHAAGAKLHQRLEVLAGRVEHDRVRRAERGLGRGHGGGQVVRAVRVGLVLAREGLRRDVEVEEEVEQLVVAQHAADRHRAVVRGRPLLGDDTRHVAAHRRARDVRFHWLAEAAAEEGRQRMRVLCALARVVGVLAVAGGGPGVALGHEEVAQRVVVDLQLRAGAGVAVGPQHEPAVPVVRHLDAIARVVVHAPEALGVHEGGRCEGQFRFIDEVGRPGLCSRCLSGQGQRHHEQSELTHLYCLQNDNCHGSMADWQP